ncbi:MAG: aminotransferase class V-fold PLP-dependent enzyme, partial [Patescibacteria group bacterium]
FTVAGIHAHDLAALLDQHHLAVRAGHHCAQPLHDQLGVAASVRASIGAYTTRQDIAALLRALRQSIALWATLTKK